MSEETDALLDGVLQHFEEQIAFFRGKKDVATRTWRDIERAAHDRAFVVAGVTKLDLLKDLHEAVDKAISQGDSIDKFRARFEEIVAKRGWTGWTGEDTREGRAWRTRTIYQTNMQTSYAAGRWRQLNDEDFAKLRPYWRYVHSGAFEPRPQHKAWGDARLTLRYDHPFWQTHFPPNGWGCGCTVYAVEAPEEGDATSPPSGWNVRDRKSGELGGVSEGWDYAPGAESSDTTLRELIHRKLIKAPYVIERVLRDETNKYFNAHSRVDDFVSDSLAGKYPKASLLLGFVAGDEVEAGIFALTKVKTRDYAVSLPASQVVHIRNEHGHDSDGQRPPKASDYARALDVLQTGELRKTEAKGRNKEPRFIARKVYWNETQEVVFEVHNGERNRSISIVTTYIHIRTGKRKTA